MSRESHYRAQMRILAVGVAVWALMLVGLVAFVVVSVMTR